MEPLANLTSSKIVPEPARANKPGFLPIESPLPIKGTEPASYEITVFNFLLAQKEPLGIKGIWRCRNIRIDGLLELNNGRRLAVEVKYRMNWEKACQACSQFGWYLNHPVADTRPITGALVFFEEFSRDWARRSPSRLLENGWNYWYTDHQAIDGIRVDLVRLRDGNFESFPTALAAAQAAAGVG